MTDTPHQGRPDLMGWELKAGVVLDVAGLPSLTYRLSDPVGVFRVLIGDEWTQARADRDADPRNWAPIGQTGWETLVTFDLVVWVRPAGGALPAGSTG